MIRIKEAVVVEGRYDKAAVAAAADTVIIDTAGFGIFADREKLALLRRLAEARGLVVLTDSDGGGLLIRNFLKSAIDPELVKHAYIPDIRGKERRKRHPSKEGKLGVEGMSRDTLEECLIRAGVTVIGGPAVPVPGEQITKADLHALGLTGKPGSAELRGALKKQLDLPENLSANALLDVLNVLTTHEELENIIRSIKTCDNRQSV